MRHGGDGFEQKTFATIDLLRGIADQAGVPLAKLALAWLLSQPGVVSVIAGARSVAQARENAAAGDSLVSPMMNDMLNRATDPLRDSMGHFSDPWGSAEEERWR